jgi:esterase/lipase superfamily enzyme
MKERHFDWNSPSLNRKMDVACFGDYGVPLILFPTAGGDYLEQERFKMIHVLKPLIEAKRLKVYTVATISRDAWLDPDAHPAHKAWIQSQFDTYIHRELLPFVRKDSGETTDIACAGSSLGAYNAVLAGSRNPGAFKWVVAMSGTYLMDRWMNGYVDKNYYLCQPTRYLPGMSGRQLHSLRATQFVIASGTGNYEAPDESVLLVDHFRKKGVDAHLELWGKDAHHDWPTWRTMLPMFLDRLLP